MSQYRSDSPDEIRAVFALEGESLVRQGFVEPDLSQVPEGYVSLEKVHLGVTAVAHGAVLSDPLANAAALGVDLEVYHQG